jgi:hypothetical protein
MSPGYWRTNRVTHRKFKVAGRQYVSETKIGDDGEEIAQKIRDPETGRFVKKPSGRPKNA